MKTLCLVVLAAAIGAGSATFTSAGDPSTKGEGYGTTLKGENFLISVHIDDSAERSRAKEIFEQNRAEDIATAGEKRVS
jgi:hypothetical protein